jgi:hypothetical protein
MAQVLRGSIKCSLALRVLSLPRRAGKSAAEAQPCLAPMLARVAEGR